MPTKTKNTKRSTQRRANPMQIVVQQQPQSYFQYVNSAGDSIRFTAANLKLAPTSQFIKGADDHTTLIADTELVGTIIIAHFPGVLSTNQPTGKSKQEKK